MLCKPTDTSHTPRSPNLCCCAETSPRRRWRSAMSANCDGPRDASGEWAVPGFRIRQLCSTRVRRPSRHDARTPPTTEENDAVRNAHLRRVSRRVARPAHRFRAAMAERVPGGAPAAAVCASDPTCPPPLGRPSARPPSRRLAAASSTSTALTPAGSRIPPSSSLRPGPRMGFAKGWRSRGPNR